MNLEDFKAILERENTAFLLGNGFSMNFDTCFGNIHERLFDTHKILLSSTNYRVNSPNAIFKKKLSNNYKSVLSEIKYFDNTKFQQIFLDAILFAESIVTFHDMEKHLRETKLISELSFGITQFDGITQIYNVGKSKGAEKVNIEYWTLLIYFYYILKKAAPKDYKFPKDNTFLKLIVKGSSPNIILGTENEPYIETCNNGMNTYFRMLYSLAIYNDSKSISCENLDKVEFLNLHKIHQFLTKSSIVLTLNYDHIIETNWPDINVVHLHGSYQIQCNNYFHYQSLSYNDGKQEVSFSDILIGDYFCNKTFFPIVASTSKGTTSTLTEDANTKISRYVREKDISNIVIFGMNISNDQDIIRYILLAFEKNQVKNPAITYCYFAESEKNEFETQYKKVITFSKAVNTYCQNVKISCIPTDVILNEYFFANN